MDQKKWIWGAICCMSLVTAWISLQRTEVIDNKQEIDLVQLRDHVAELASAPRVPKSDTHRAALDRMAQELTDLGIAAEIHERVFTVSKPGFHKSRDVRNLLIHLPGQNPEHSILFSAHYDTVEGSPGAGDNAAAVVSLFQAVKILHSEKGFQHDLYFLFSDEEEAGLFGMRAFVEQNPAAENLSLVFNFDGRGNSGPVLMFETSDNNDWLVQQFARATKAANAHSLSNNIYKLMPNFTDFTVFKRKRPDVQGLNFAHIEGPLAYHSTADVVEHLDEAVMLHQTRLVLDLARWFGNIADIQTSASDRVYFCLPGLGMVGYAATTAKALLALIVVSFAGLWFLWTRRFALKTGLVLKSAGAFVASLVLTLLLFLGLGLLAIQVLPGLGDSDIGHPANTMVYLGLLAVTFIIVYGFSARFLLKRFEAPALMLGKALVLFLLSLAGSLLLPGANFLFCLPMIATLAAFFGLLGSRQPVAHSVAAGISVLVALLIWVPILRDVYLGLGFFMLHGLAIFAIVALAYAYTPLFLLGYDSAASMVAENSESVIGSDEGTLDGALS